MIKVLWELDEAVALLDLYIKNGKVLQVPDAQLIKLGEIYKKRAQQRGITTDDKFRNLAGLRMQIGCIHYVVTDGKEGLARAAKVFYEAYDLYKKNPVQFQAILDTFYKTYGCD